ncbi:MAG: hypothetical protein H6834_01150 [Planctomycetes bacterium]|nr:hypothetical protein [Planctomycetota bacterium]
MHFDRSARVVLATFTSLVAGLSAHAQTYTNFGSRCTYGLSSPALHANGLPALGQTMQIQLTEAAPSSVAVLLFGFAKFATPLDLGFVGATGCQLWMLPDINVSIGVGTTGVAIAQFTIPLDASLTGISLHNQWIDLTVPTIQVTSSNGGTMTLGPVPPAISSPVFGGPASGPVGTVVTLRVKNLGTSNPDDICLRVAEQATGNLSLLKVTNIVKDTVTGEDVITARLATANAKSPVRGDLGLMRGAGATPPVNPSTCLSTPFSAWAWQGTSLPGADLTVPGAFMPTASGNQVAVNFIYEASSNSLYVDVPAYPFGNGGLYPVGAGITTDAHGDLSCGGSVPGGHFDHMIETVNVLAACANMTNQTVAVEHAPQVQQAFDNTFGPGRLIVTSETTGSLARIRIKPTNPLCTLTGGGGSLVVTQ